MASLKQRLEDFYRKCPEGLGRAEQWTCEPTFPETPSSAAQQPTSTAPHAETDIAVLTSRLPVRVDHTPG